MPTEQQLSAMIDAAVREAVERTTRELTAKHEAETEGLRRKRDELLNKVADKPWQSTLDEADAAIARADEALRKAREQEQRWSSKKDDANPFVAPREVTLSREAARSGEAYREAKAAAEKAGVPLRILDDHGPAQTGKRSSPVKYVKDADAGVLYVNADMIQRYGQARCREIAAEQGASTVRAFRSIEDLPKPMQQAHAQAMADRSNLLGDQ